MSMHEQIQELLKQHGKTPTDWMQNLESVDDLLLLVVLHYIGLFCSPCTNRNDISTDENVVDEVFMPQEKGLILNTLSSLLETLDMLPFGYSYV